MRRNITVNETSGRLFEGRWSEILRLFTVFSSLSLVNLSFLSWAAKLEGNGPVERACELEGGQNSHRIYRHTF